MGLREVTFCEGVCLWSELGVYLGCGVLLDRWAKGDEPLPPWEKYNAGRVERRGLNKVTYFESSVFLLCHSVS